MIFAKRRGHHKNTAQYYAGSACVSDKLLFSYI